MNPISSEEIKDTSDINLETKRKFIESVIATFEKFYTVSDVNTQVDTMRSFGDDATAVISLAYGALKSANVDIVEFVEATKLLAAQSDQE